MAKELLEMWTIYKHPSDYPDGYVARKFLVGLKQGAQPTDIARYCSDIEAARLAVGQAGMNVCIPRSEADEPVIVETWM